MSILGSIQFGPRCDSKGDGVLAQQELEDYLEVVLEASKTSKNKDPLWLCTQCGTRLVKFSDTPLVIGCEYCDWKEEVPKP